MRMEQFKTFDILCKFSQNVVVFVPPHVSVAKNWPSWLWMVISEYTWWTSPAGSLFLIFADIQSKVRYKVFWYLSVCNTGPVYICWHKIFVFMTRNLWSLLFSLCLPYPVVTTRTCHTHMVQYIHSHSHGSDTKPTGKHNPNLIYIFDLLIISLSQYFPSIFYLPLSLR